MSDTYLQDKAIVKASVEKAHREHSSIYVLPFGAGHPDIDRLRHAAGSRIWKKSFIYREVLGSDPYRVEDILWHPFPCDTSAHMIIVMESLKQAHSKRATTFEIPLETDTYGLDEFEVAVHKYLSDHASRYGVLERYPPIFDRIQWKPASEVE